MKNLLEVKDSSGLCVENSSQTHLAQKRKMKIFTLAEHNFMHLRAHDKMMKVKLANILRDGRGQI